MSPVKFTEGDATMVIKKEIRIWQGAPARLMVEAEGYVMVRRKGGVPFVVGIKDWSASPLAAPGEGNNIDSRMLRAPGGE